ncbi:hydrogenase expression/formation protein HypE [Phormidium yuhuli AB48]|uniref:Hydrogenase expression/formation protein HypE n=1 Tax=Phormidium yuhuli AB48 TaxID=2940671 RepID=A0ABY5AV13_9CYAN|nr:hydrogenase expression/formation protein HypE [Phormidium yuhuli]USR92171.1 hydrogenase expression/formation protein HypE [Phormidium yuhuli AB48]
MSDFDVASLSCPLPIEQYPHVLLAHGGGGRLMQQLINQVFLPAFGGAEQVQHDAATLSLGGDRIALTTDSYVVHPLFFPGGDIGSMAVYGTVNDLAMAGAQPQYLTAGFILEEGLPMSILWQVVQSMAAAAKTAGVRIVTGDTKVVDRGKGDGIFINTAGVGVVRGDRTISPSQVQVGDVVLVNGDIGRHGIAIMAVREGLMFETAIESDSAPVAADVLALLDAGIEVHCLRDLTRGGLASALNEIAVAANLGVRLDERAIAVRDDVQGACEILGFDPLYLANEGRFIAIVPSQQAEAALECLGDGAAEIGVVTETSKPPVTMMSEIGSLRTVDLLSGEQLPRIC